MTRREYPYWRPEWAPINDADKARTRREITDAEMWADDQQPTRAELEDER